MQKSDENKILTGVALVAVFVIGAVLWRANTHRGGAGSGAKPAQEFAKTWTLTVGAVHAGLALAEDGTLYAASEDGTLYAIDAAGKLSWKATIGPTKAAPAVAEDGTIYLANEDQMVYAIGRDGKQKWNWGGGRYANKNSPWRAGALDFGHFYTPWRGQMRAFRLDGGPPDWPTGMGFEDAGAAAILPSGTLVYAGLGRLTASDMQGRTSWEYPAPDPPVTVDYLLEHNGRPPVGNLWVESAMAVDDDGTFYAAISGSRLMAFTPDGAVKWEFKTPRQSTNYASPVIAGDGTIYFATGDGAIYALNRDGSQKWVLEIRAQVMASPVLAADGTLFVASVNAIHAVAPDGRIIAKTAFGNGGTSSPTLAPDGTLYVASRTGTIVAYSTPHGGLMKSPWPKFQRDVANTGRAQGMP